MSIDPDARFERWRAALVALDGALEIPSVAPLDPGPERRVSAAWRSAMEARNDLLEPLALELARAWTEPLSDSARGALRSMLAEHRLVLWQWPGVISRALARYLGDSSRQAFEAACALVALYDLRAESRDFQRTFGPFLAELDRRNADVRAMFREAIALAPPHEDPDRGAHGLFVSLAAQDRASDDDGADDDDDV